MSEASSPLLIFGYGNPSRGDDALGPLMMDHLADQLTRCPTGTEIDLLTDFQLQPEHAMDLVGRPLVLFIDASLTCTAPYQLTRLAPSQDLTYTTHAMSPAAILHACEASLSMPAPPTFVLAVRGESFNLGEGLSDKAKMHLEAATSFLDMLLQRADVEQWNGYVSEVP